MKLSLSISLLLISSTLCGCAVFDDGSSNDLGDNDSQAWYSLSTASEPLAPLESSLMFQRQFQQRLTDTKLTEDSSAMEPSAVNNQFKENARSIAGANLNINDYTRVLMQDLVANLKSVNATTPLAVVSFVMLDSDYNQSSLLGNQMAESLIHEIHKFGIPVIDYKTTGFIRITEQGDFAFSKDYEELGINLAAQYIVGGTMSKHQEGYLINARIVGMESKAVVAAAQSFIPNAVADALVTSKPLTSMVKSGDASGTYPSVTEPALKPAISLLGN